MIMIERGSLRDPHTSHTEVISCAQKRLIENTLMRSMFIDRRFTERFYDRLFELDPTLRPLFPVNLRTQARKLLDMLVFIVMHLEQWDEMLITIEGLGRRHSKYHVPLAAYDTVRAALLWTFEYTLGSAFTPQAKEAWTTAYTLLADQMKLAQTKDIQERRESR